jgi:3-phosphoshikimate 1-carboxyvinyltransferase
MPGDKSISHRAAILAALAEGRSRIEGFASSADCASTIECFRQLGVGIAREGQAVCVNGKGLAALEAAPGPLDCGNSGSTMRMLVGVLAGQPFDSVLTGDESLTSRPMRRVIDPLKLMGADISSHDGRAPLTVHGRRPLTAIRYVTPIASAQVKSCVLLAGLFAEGETTVVEKLGSTRDHTERMLRWFGVDVRQTTENGFPTISLTGGSPLFARTVTVPGDPSSAAFFIAAAALLDGSDLTIEQLGLNPTRNAFVSTVKALGADITVENEREECNEPVGELRVRGGARLSGPNGGPAVLNGPQIAHLIDELPILAVVGTQVNGGLVVRDAAELRVKESDRISATVGNLRAMGAEVEEYEDGFAVNGPTRLKGARIETFGDHRIAMAFSIAALLAEGETEIAGAECVSVSFPEFYDLLSTVVTN